MNALDERPETSHRPEPGRMALRLLPAMLLLLAAVLAWTGGLGEWLDVQTLAEQRAGLEAFVRARPVLAALAFVAVYALATLLSIPGAAILTITCGLLFGVWLGACLAVIGATIGAVGVFLIARTSLGEILRQRAGPRLQRMAEAFHRDGFSYLLVLRLIPIFPFWLVNLVPALLGMRLLPYTVATAIGIVPGSLVYAGVGDGLGALLEAGSEPDPSLLLEPRVLLPLLGLALLSLLPVAYRRLRGRETAGADG